MRSTAPVPYRAALIDDFIDRKHGRKKIEYELPELQEILQETLGVIVYQEQVMQIANRLAGYSLGEADLLRRAMGKKKHEEMAQQRERFIEGGGATRVSAEEDRKDFRFKWRSSRATASTKSTLPRLMRFWLITLRTSRRALSGRVHGCVADFGDRQH